MNLEVEIYFNNDPTVCKYFKCVGLGYDETGNWLLLGDENEAVASVMIPRSSIHYAVITNKDTTEMAQTH